MKAASKQMQSAFIDFELASIRLDAVRKRVAREGLTREAEDVFLEAVNEMTLALCGINAARRTTQFDPDSGFYDLMAGL